MEAWLLFPIRIFSVVLVAALAYFLCDRVQEGIVSSMNRSIGTDSEVADSDFRPVAERISTIPLIVGMATFVVVLLSVESVYFHRFALAMHQIEALGGSIRFDPAYEGSFARYFANTATVDLSESSVDDSKLPHLWCIPNLKSVRLANTKIGASAIRHVTWCHALESLDISSTPVVDSDLSPLKRIRKLRSLLMNDTAITDNAVIHFSNCRKLKKLELSGTQLSENGYRNLSSALPDATVVVASVTT